MAANKDLNRLKVVLVEKKKSSLYQSNWDVRQRRCRNGVLIRRNLHWRC